MSRPRGVVFDMDGLLLDTERVWERTFQETMTLHGLPANDDLFASLVGLNAVEGRERLSRALNGETDPEKFDTDWIEAAEIVLSADIAVKPGVHALAAALRDADIPYVIATSTTTNKAIAHLSRAGLSDLFPDVIGGDQVVRGKPAPDIYLAAVAALTLPANVCVAFEDSPNGVRAAIAAGLITVQVPDVVAPDADLIALGHHIAPDLLSGACGVGLIDELP